MKMNLNLKPNRRELCLFNREREIGSKEGELRKIEKKDRDREMYFV